MHCLGCNYNLHGLPENRCPECGRTFDPHDPDTYASSANARRGMPAWVVVVFAVYPVVPQALLYLTWGVAKVSLGHAPRPNLDDPSYIDAAVSSLCGITWAAISVLIACVPGVPVLLFCYVLFGRGTNREIRGLLLFFLFVLCLMIFAASMTSQVGKWFWD